MTGAYSSLRILVIDDEADQRSAVTGLFAQHGMSLMSHAATADEGVERASAEQPDLILLDLVMPGRSGVEVLPELRDAAPDASIVVLSNMPRRRMLRVALALGAVGYVEKGVPPGRLVDEILLAAALTEAVYSHVIDLPADTSSAGQGRRFARERLSDTAQQVVADVELLVSELITNAVVHATSQPRLEIHVSRRIVRVEVYDKAAAVPYVAHPGIEQPGGRGMGIVETIATSWGTEPHGDGKLVWFEIEHAAPA